MRKNLLRVVAGAAVVAVAATGLFSTSAQALPPGTAAAGAGVLSPLFGTNTSSFAFAPPTGSVCQGDGVALYRWSTFMVAASVDPATLIYNASGPVSQGGAYTMPLFNTAGSPQVAKTPGLGSGLLTPIPAALDFANVTMPVPNGAYNIGYACTLTTAGVMNTTRFWVTPITVSSSTATTFDWSFGAAPAQPVLGALTGAFNSFTGSFTSAVATPAVGANGYTLTAVPTAGPGVATVTQSFSATGAFTFNAAGLVNGTTYSVTMTAANTAGTSPVSNTQTVFVNPATLPPPTNLQAVPGLGNFALSWTAPTGAAPTGYTVAVSPTVAGSPFTVSSGTSLTVSVACTVIPPGSSFTVTPTHAAPFVGAAAIVTGIVSLCDGTVIQDITVVRPAGALVLTQRCNVNGPLGIEPASPGFPALPAVIASADQVGQAPTLLAGGLGGPDGQFTNYPTPSPVAGETHCGVNLGSGQLVKSGPLTGQYYTASGLINQVTVSDTRDTDIGWTVNGTMSTFNVVGGGSSFSGNYLGWSPVVTDDSDLTSGGYNQLATAGATVLPDTATGLATPTQLARALGGAGLGIASFDARLKLLIPVSARAGTYNGTLTFTVV